MAKEEKKLSEESDEEVQKKSLFADFSDPNSEEEKEEEDEKQEPVENLPKNKSSNKKNKKNSKKKEAKKHELKYDDLILELDQNQLVIPDSKSVQLIPCLKRSSKHFDSSYELNELFHEKKKSKSSSHQKNFILTPSLKKSNQAINYLPSMELKNEKFSFEMSKGYLKLYQNYLLCIESNDPGLLHDFSNKYPFHIEALYQLCLIYKMQAKYEQVYQILERILYSFQLSFHHQFSPIGRNANIDMNSTSLNKVFFKSLFMMIDCLGRKGCYRTALEYVKFLLCLDFKDPMGCLLLIDFYSLSTKKFSYFIYFCENFMKEYYTQHKLLILPTTIYSLALSKAMLSNNFQISEQDVNKAFAINNIYQIAEESGNVILLVAVSTFPLVAKSLFTKVAPTYEFTAVNENIAFDYSVLAEIYSTRNLELWRNENCIAWLKQAAQEVEIIGCKEYNEIWEYPQLDIHDFTFNARNLIPQDLAFGK